MWKASYRFRRNANWDLYDFGDIDMESFTVLRILGFRVSSSYRVRQTYVES